ncbi:MAG: helix-turn-helix domain-containing protein [Verrucomicrobiota bacterium]
MNTEERWVGVEDIAAHLNVSMDSLYWWIDRKGFPAQKVLRLPFSNSRKSMH